MGRPSGFTEELGRRICDLIAEGSSLDAISKMPGMPPRSTVRSWLETHPDFERNFAIARRYWAQTLEERLVELAGQSQQIAAEAEAMGRNPNAAVQAHKIELDSLRWLMAHAAPSLYSDRNQVELTGKDGSELIPRPADDKNLVLSLLAVLHAGEKANALENSPLSAQSLLEPPEPEPPDAVALRAIYSDVRVDGEPIVPVFDHAGKVVRLDPRGPDREY